MISHLTLTNILAFRRIELELRELTLLSGTNSAGKSSILHSLALLRQSHEAGTLPGSWMLNGNLVELGTGRDLLHADPIEVGNVDSVVVGISTRENGREASWVARYVAEADVLSMSPSPGEREAAWLEHDFQYLRADRIVPSVIYPKSHEASSVRRWLGARGEHVPNYLREFGGDPAPCVPARHPEAIGSGLLDQTNRWLAELSPGTAMTVDDVPMTDLVRLTYSRLGPDVKTTAHRATNVGFGLTYALPIIVACLVAKPGMLLLVENPEAHLHPAGQAVVGRLCALATAGGAQVIVETHSDHVLNAIRLCVKRREIPPDLVALHFFSRHERELQPRVDSMELSLDGSLPNWPPGFFDQWDLALDELLDS